MHTPGSVLRAWLLPIAALGLGCSSTGRLGHRANDPEMRTIASIGDRPVKAVAGAPASSSAVADLDDRAAPRDRAARVSGRVVDDRGEPVPGARVRIADGGLSGGRVVEATSDRAGGFTLRGLRPGSEYTLIAEYEGPGGWVEGRADVRSPDTEVEIAVRADDGPADRRRADRSPSGRKVSGRRPLDPDGTIPSRVNDDDLPEGSDEADDLASRTPATKKRSAVAVSNSNSGWRPSRAAPDRTSMADSGVDDRATRRASTRPADSDADSDDADEPRARAPRRRIVDDPPPEDDEENPLPPAIEPESGARRGRGADLDRDPDSSAARSRPSRRVSQAEPHRPGPPPGALALAKEAKPPRPPARPGPEPAPAPAIDAEPVAPAPPAEVRAFDPFPAPKKPATWADLSAAWDAAAPAGGEVSPEPRPSPPADERRAAPLADRPRTAPPVAVAGTAPVETCRYDSQRRQILDFRLPDLDGRPVSLNDFDADFILLDFWGTWCRPCLSSVPHLVELQKRFGPGSLAVVGIACESGPASASAAHVADVARRLGIDYTVLLSSKDDSASPMQEALHIQAYPTMVLIDRTGRVVWRDQGATTTTLSRLDRILAVSMKATSTNAVRR